MIVSIWNIFSNTFTNKSMSATLWVSSNLSGSHTIKVVFNSCLNIFTISICFVDFWINDAWEHLSIEWYGFLTKDLWISNIAFCYFIKRIIMESLLQDLFNLCSPCWDCSSDCIFSIYYLFVNFRFRNKLRSILANF